MTAGIDLSGSEKRPSGWASLHRSRVRTAVFYSDADILAATLAAAPRVIAIDSPLSLPASGIIRESERELMALRVGVYPSLLPSMRALTQRGIALKAAFESLGFTVIEGFPGAAQDALGIPRKKASPEGLRNGLAALGLRLPDGELTHHELDAATAALIARYYLRGQFHEFGAPGEVPIVTPLAGRTRIRLTAADPQTLRYAANYLAFFHGIRLTASGTPVPVPAFRKRTELRQWLYGLAMNACTSRDSSASAGR